MTMKTEDAFRRLRKLLSSEGYTVTDVKDISYGKQFRVDGELFRMYQSKKKGITLDASTSKNEILSGKINSIFKRSQEESTSSPDFDAEKKKSVRSLKPASATGPGSVLPPLAGSDEVGKGDYFAPLTVCCAYLDEREYEILETLGVRDSKALSDRTIQKLAEQIKQVTKNYSIMSISHAGYNRLYERVGNINRILSDAHAKAARAAYEKHPFKTLLVDRFAKTSSINQDLSDLDLDIHIYVRAEENIAVAAASILARDMMLKYMKKMNEKYKMKFPLGAGNDVIYAGKAFVKRFGEDELKNVCKYHFRNTEKILGRKS